MPLPIHDSIPPPAAAEQNLTKIFARLWWRSIRNVLLGSLVSLLPAFSFYSVAFSYTPLQMQLLGRILLGTLLVAFGVDLLLNRWYLGPALGWREADGARDAGRIYKRLHNFTLFSFVRVFGPHAVLASAAAQLAVLYANAYWDLAVPTTDFAVYWLLNLTLVPIGHAIFEYHANGWVSREVLAALAEKFPAAASTKVWRVGLATRLTIFYTLLAVSPLVLLAAAVRLWPLPSGVYVAALGRIGVVIAGVAGLNLLLLLLFALDVRGQTRLLLHGLEHVENEDLETRVNLFSPDEFGVISEGVNKMIVGLRERRRIRELFGVYLSPEVSQAILEGKVALEGEAREVSILFCDIRDFTRFCTSRGPRQVVDRLNQFFSRMSVAIRAHGGTINKFLGDGFLAVFGAPVQQPDHARCAVEAALQIEKELAAFNTELRSSGEPEIEIGIGIDTGEVIAGNVGSTDRKEYTIIGDPVNRSSRIEQLNKSHATRILISARTHDGSGLGGGRALEPVMVKGIEEPLRVVTVGAKS